MNTLCMQKDTESEKKNTCERANEREEDVYRKKQPVHTWMNETTTMLRDTCEV